MAQNRQYTILSAIPTSANVDKLALDDVGVFNGVIYTCTNPTIGSATFNSSPIGESFTLAEKNKLASINITEIDNNALLYALIF